jgi:hypothetical protein
MNFATVLVLCFGVLVLAGVYEALQARWELYRKHASLRQDEDSELRLASDLPIVGPTMANGGETNEG